MGKVTMEEVKTMCEVNAKKYWGMEYNLEVTRNNRFKRALGMYRYKRNRFTGEIFNKRIELAGDLLNLYDRETVEDVIKHELAHWALLEQGKPNQDGHPVFENELVRIGASSTRTIVGKRTVISVMVRCSCCNGKVARRTRAGATKLTKSGFLSGCCRAPLVKAEEIEM